jgi:hypothetical protein
MSGSRWILPLLALAICGCGSSAIPAIPTPRAPSNPQQSNARVVAQADPRLDAVVGRLQAVESLISQADSLVGSAFAAQYSQLTDSANRDFVDARNNLDGARLVLRLVGDPSRYRRAATLLGGALNWYTLAVSAGVRDQNRAQDAADRGRNSLLQADALLAKSAEADQLPTIAAKAAAMDVASRLIASRTRQVVRKRSSRPRPSHRIAYRPPPTATPQPTAIPVPTATPTFKRVPKQQHAPRRPRSRSVHPRPHPTATPTATPKPTQAARTTRIAAGAPKPARSTTVPHLSHAFSGAFADVARATRRIDQCSGYISSLGTGSDPLGSIKIVGCVDRARHRLERLLRRLALTLHGQASVAVKTPVASAYAHVLQSKVALQRAKKDVQSVRIEEAQTALAAAASHVRAAQAALARAQRALETK